MRRILKLFALLAVCASPAFAQQTPKPQGDGGDPFGKFFYPPEFVMQHQSDIGLTDTQRNVIMKAMQQAQSTFIESQFKLSSEAEKLQKLVQKPVVDEAQALEQVDRVLAAERELKRAQVGLVVRIKNALTPQQQAKLNEMRGGKVE